MINYALNFYIIRENINRYISNKNYINKYARKLYLIHYKVINVKFILINYKTVYVLIKSL